MVWHLQRRSSWQSLWKSRKVMAGQTIVSKKVHCESFLPSFITAILPWIPSRQSMSYSWSWNISSCASQFTDKCDVWWSSLSLSYLSSVACPQVSFSGHVCLGLKLPCFVSVMHFRAMQKSANKEPQHIAPKQSSNQCKSFYLIKYGDSIFPANLSYMSAWMQISFAELTQYRLRGWRHSNDEYLSWAEQNSSQQGRSQTPACWIKTWMLTLGDSCHPL